MNQKSIAVIGGGISGIATAYYLQQRGFQVEVLESESQIGGRMATANLRGRNIALGGKNIGRKYSLFREFTQSMGDNPFEYFGLNSSRVRNGKIITFDEKKRYKGMWQFLKSCSLKDLIRLIPMMRAVKSNRSKEGYLGGNFFNDLQKKYPNGKLSSIFSKELCQQFIRPVTVRMNGAEPSEAFIGNFGSNLSITFDTYEQLTNGLGPLFEQFESGVPVRSNCKVKSILLHKKKVVGVKVEENKKSQDLYYDYVILSTPASVSMELVSPHFPELEITLGQVRYFPVAVVVAEYEKPVFTKEVRALVFPETKALSNAGVYGVNDRHIVRYTFSGAVARELLSKNPKIEDLVNLGESTLSEFIPISENPRIAYTGKIMKLGLCAYAQNYENFSKSLASQLEKVEGLDLTGDYIRGAAIEGCFQAAKECANRVASKLQDQGTVESATRELADALVKG
ncbi:hypothetical protein CH373_05230 [Leptospira perolatii]|uniref:Amine oxidase domain-containing protein n=1 Tax=Leptospira perolatii TaxID=2023191 RepID=A0A2M9ZQG3_9LEPT|nr:FAD-dependent oxidoreductase [Leptospira perolatii]PJZ70476.1 hypothetical protein CH360_05650 [Leptospira perolatii]PJZ74312.1 hypothetical protein CH373_05230 [Leptospira perolatii]